MAGRRLNILLIMADQMAAPALPVYGHEVVRAPYISALAERGVVYDAAYCASPLCVPARASLMTGQLPSRIGAYDNAADLASSTPTVAHYLRHQGYRTLLAGKMHFVGPDQLHGFEQRLTTDIYPADFGWVPDWSSEVPQTDWYHNLDSVREAGPATCTMQMDFDDAAAFEGVRAIHDHARSSDPRPLFLCVSFTHPHDPYNIAPTYWDRYDEGDIDLPLVQEPAEPDPHSRRLTVNFGEPVTRQQIGNARRAYYGAISYVDDKVGQLRQALADTGLAHDTVIVFTSDHGDMLGERGLWYKMSFFEWSARVPMIIHAPGRLKPTRVATPVSHLDLLPTLAGLAADGHPPEPVDPLDGASLLDGVDRDRLVAGEYLAEGAAEPIVMLRQGRYKVVHAEHDPLQLYDLEGDPDERQNLAGKASLRDAEQAITEAISRRWHLADLHRQVAASQERRRFVHAALRQGRQVSWDYRPDRSEDDRYIRNNGTALQDQERSARLAPRRG